MVKYCIQDSDAESMTEKILWIQMRGGPPWGFRMKGGKGADAPLVISMVSKLLFSLPLLDFIFLKIIIVG